VLRVFKEGKSTTYELELSENDALRQVRGHREDANEQETNLKGLVRSMGCERVAKGEENLLESQVHEGKGSRSRSLATTPVTNSTTNSHVLSIDAFDCDCFTLRGHCRVRSSSIEASVGPGTCLSTASWVPDLLLALG
jgi:hypothetical protein